MLLTNNTYQIQLSGGQKWGVVASEKAGTWLKQFSSILQLEAGASNGQPKLIFVCNEDEEERQLKAQGWQFDGCHSITGLIRHPDITVPEDKPVKFWFHPSKADVICDIGQEEAGQVIFYKMWLALYPFFQKAQETGGFPFHAGLAALNGKGILLAGTGGVGKSTCCRRLPDAWKVLCDDEVLIAQVTGHKYFVHPFPTWSDHILERPVRKTYDVQRRVPLAAVFFLQQAAEDKVVPLKQGEAALYIYDSAMQSSFKNWRHLPKEKERIYVSRLLDNACELAKKIPAFKLRVSLNGRFWEEIERVI